VLEVLDEGCAEGRLREPVSAEVHLPVLRLAMLTLPAPAGPMTRTPNFDILSALLGVFEKVVVSH
jgi:hypothetical protein